MHFKALLWFVFYAVKPNKPFGFVARALPMAPSAPTARGKRRQGLAIPALPAFRATRPGYPLPSLSGPPGGRRQKAARFLPPGRRRRPSHRPRRPRRGGARPPGARGPAPRLRTGDLIPSPPASREPEAPPPRVTPRLGRCGSPARGRREDGSGRQAAPGGGLFGAGGLGRAAAQPGRAARALPGRHRHPQRRHFAQAG